MEKRPLVWLSAAQGNTLIRGLLQPRWSLIDFDFSKPVSLFPNTPDAAKVGVLELPENVETDLPQLEKWLEAIGIIYWVAIAPEKPHSRTSTANLIVRYCSDFHTQPVDAERLNTVLGHLWGMASMKESTSHANLHDYGDLALLGSSAAIQNVHSLLRRFSATLEPVLITGESSTGKDAGARFIHNHSIRATGPLIFVNCAALPSTLTHSELFGYEKGAFTSAQQSHPGRLEQANGGTLVFSGINELHLEQQSALLRFLQEGEVQRVGSNTRISANGRVIATTTQPLQELVAVGLFRSDVYFRLGNLEVVLPPLRDRCEDIPALAQTLLEASLPGLERKRLSDAAMHCLINHSWPGNLQELQNRLRRGVLLSEQTTIEPADLGLRAPSAGRSQPSNLSLQAFRDQADHQALICSLRLSNNNLSEAARVLKISRASFYRLLEKHNPQPPSRGFRQNPTPKGDAT
ncbi:Nitrogen assimilation regulatory protein [Marinobacter litoralis]|uniref:Nitrogen assimilation regulatory protein n=1 Tax=Marinobacter litoralis TaxID=187981 RepID=A0A3M2RH67_9GAMM|nr:sigma-54 dependent transcriptional regulator [Marinobacter litoralis]RMJ04582.1 Nitrogen assimilation regulatory protein [Marinobacter litoralis]